MQEHEHRLTILKRSEPPNLADPVKAGHESKEFMFLPAFFARSLCAKLVDT
jgi:hypothetical protein